MEKMKKIIRLTESDLIKIVKRIIKGNDQFNNFKLNESENLNLFEQDDNNYTDLERIEYKIIKYLNEADDKLDSDDFSRLADSILDYIDEIGRSKR
jgi:hypothetical protein